MTTAYDFTAQALDGQPKPLADYRGKVLLIVNVASKCGFTPQYTGLEALQRKYAGRGLEVLGFPCNQFGAQEPGNAEEIASFCSLTYEVSFPLFAKIEVNGPRADPLYAFLKFEKPGCSAPRRSSGTSPSSWLARMARWRGGMRPPSSPRRWRAISRRCWPEGGGGEAVPLTQPSPRRGED